jgi:hypothetical protein
VFLPQRLCNRRAAGYLCIPLTQRCAAHSTPTPHRPFSLFRSPPCCRGRLLPRAWARVGCFCVHFCRPKELMRPAKLDDVTRILAELQADLSAKKLPVKSKPAASPASLRSAYSIFRAEAAARRAQSTRARGRKCGSHIHKRCMLHSRTIVWRVELMAV